MKLSEKIILPLLVISIITALGCYYILEEYNEKQFEIKKGITSEPQDGDMIVSEEDLKRESTVILVGKDADSGILTFCSTDADQMIELSYNTSTRFLGKRGKNMVLDQMQIGEIVDVTYSIHSKVLETVQVSSNAWSYTDVKRFSINEKARTMEIADSKYRMESSVIVSYGDKLAKLFDVTSVDTLIVKGIDKKVCSIIVDKGHGYIRLKNDTYFVGGWLEVGQEIIKPISESMLLPVPEGDYHIRVTNRGYVGDEDVTIQRDKETEVDLSKIEITEVAIGHVQFDIHPDFAQLYVDGQMTEFDERVPMEYGIHSIRVEFAGYETVNTNIKVNAEFADVSITLDKISGESDSSSSTSDKLTSSSSSTLTYSTPITAIPAKTSSSYSTWYVTRTPTPTPTAYVTGTASSSSTSSSSSADSSGSSSDSSSSSSDSTSSSSSSSSSTDVEEELNTSSSSSTDVNPSDSSSSTDSTSSSMDSESTSSSSETIEVIENTKKIYIEEPVGAEVYIDGVYVGIIPASCKKPAGTHIITINKNGYTPKSYTVDIDNDDNDVTFSFSDLY